MVFHNGEHIAGGLASTPAEVETMNSYEDRIDYYQSQNFTYIPIPESEKYYNTKKGWLKDIESLQHIKTDSSLEEVFHRLQKVPFLLVSSHGDNQVVINNGNFVGHFSYSGGEYRWLDYQGSNARSGGPPSPTSYDESMIYSVHSIESKYPSIASKIHSDPYEERYGIITLADLNRRYTKDALYPLVAELAYLLSLKIEDRYSDSEEILKHLRPGTVGRWYLSKQQGIHMHVAEQMTLVEMQEVVRGSDSDFVEECGFSSKNQVQKKLGSINEVRNKVMHANRSLVRDRQDLQKLVDRLSMLEEVVESLRETVGNDRVR